MSMYIIGDTHFRDNLDDLNWEKNQKDFLSFCKELDLSKDDSFIHTGDLFHKVKARGTTIKNVGLIIKYLSDTCKEVILLEGNHANSKWAGNLIDSIDLYYNVKVIKDVYYSKDVDTLFLPAIEGLPVGGKYEDYVNDYVSTNNVGSITNIIGHHAFKDNAIMDSPYLDIDLLKVKFDRVIQGHIHKFETFKRNLRSEDICIGAIAPMTKGEMGIIPHYLRIEDNIVEFNEIDKKYFMNFIMCDWSGGTVPDMNNKFVIVKCKCKKEERYVIEQDIRKQFSSNLYEIEWELIEDDKVENIDMQSDDKLVTKFFEENKYSKSVKDLFENYSK